MTRQINSAGVFRSPKPSRVLSYVVFKGYNIILYVIQGLPNWPNWLWKQSRRSRENLIYNPLHRFFHTEFGRPCRFPICVHPCAYVNRKLYIYIILYCDMSAFGCIIYVLCVCVCVCGCLWQGWTKSFQPMVTSYIAFTIIWVVQEKHKSRVPESVSQRYTQ